MSRPPLLHVLGGGPWQTLTVRRAKALGYDVLVTDMYAERPAYAFADRHEVVDITNREATLDAARRHRVDGILCDTTDVGVPTAAWVAERLGLPGIGFEAALNCTHKGRLRERAAAAGVPSPRFRVIGPGDRDDAGGGDLAFPLIVKPVDNQSSRGVRRVECADALPDALAHARRHSRAGEILLEECIDGTEVIVDGFVDAGTVHVLGMAEKIPYADTPAVAARITYPAALPDEVHRRIGDTNARVVRAVGLANGIFHAEYIVRPDGTPVPIDLAARGGGCHIYTRIVPHLSGVDVQRAMIEFALGRPPQIAPQERTAAANLEFLRAPAGIFHALEGLDAATAVPGVAMIPWQVRPGERIGGLDDKDARPGYVLALGATRNDVVKASEEARSRLRVRMEGRDRPEPLT